MLVRVALFINSYFYDSSFESLDLPKSLYGHHIYILIGEYGINRIRLSILLVKNIDG